MTHTHIEVSAPGRVTSLSPCGTLIPGTTEPVTTETAGARPGDTGPTREPSPEDSSPTRRLPFGRPHLPGQSPPAPSAALPNPSWNAGSSRAELARAQRRRAGRPCVVAAILGLWRAAEAGTTRATPSAGVAAGRVGDDDSAEAHTSCQLGSKSYSEQVMIDEDLKTRGPARKTGGVGC